MVEFMKEETAFLEKCNQAGMHMPTNPLFASVTKTDLPFYGGKATLCALQDRNSLAMGTRKVIECGGEILPVDGAMDTLLHLNSLCAYKPTVDNVVAYVRFCLNHLWQTHPEIDLFETPEDVADRLPTDETKKQQLLGSIVPLSYQGEQGETYLCMGTGRVRADLCRLTVSVAKETGSLSIAVGDVLFPSLPLKEIAM